MRSGLVLTLAMTVSLSTAYAEESRWEPAIQQFEEQDAKNAPEKGGILFIGSSSIRFWDTDDAFPEHNVINRGFGGSQMSDSVEFADRIALPYEPRLVVVYAGDNDIAAGKTPDVVLADFNAFVETIHGELPETEIAFVAIKPSLARWQLVEPMREANALVKAVTEKDDRLHFIDIDTPMIGEDGKPREALFIRDGLHLSEEGYALWNEIVLPYLGEPAE